MVRSLFSCSSMASSKGPKSICPRSAPISRDSSPAASSLASMPALISARSSTAAPRVPTSSSSGTSSRESVSFSSSPTFSSRPPRSSCCFSRSSISLGLYTIPAPSSALGRPALVLTTTGPRRPAQHEGECRDYEQGSQERHDGPDQYTVARSHKHKGHHAGTGHDERDGPYQDEQQGLGMHAVHAAPTPTSLPCRWLLSGPLSSLRRRRPVRPVPRRNPSRGPYLFA